MNEISFPLLYKWRCSISLNGSGKENFFKHNRASVLMEAQPRLQRAVKKLCCAQAVRLSVEKHLVSITAT